MLQWNGPRMKGMTKNYLNQQCRNNDNFARHRRDMEINNSFKVKSTPKDESPVYTQSLPVPINLKEDLAVELTLMHRYGITTLTFSKYASPIFA